MPSGAKKNAGSAAILCWWRRDKRLITIRLAGVFGIIGKVYEEHGTNAEKMG